MCRTRLVRLYLSILDAYVIIIALYTYYICSKLSGVDDEDVVIDTLLSISTNVSLSLIFLATTLEFSINFW